MSVGNPEEKNECPSLDEIEEYRRGGFDESQATEIRKHLEDCRRCQQIHGQIVALVSR